MTTTICIMERTGSCVIVDLQKVRKTCAISRSAMSCTEAIFFGTLVFGPKAGRVLGFGIYGRTHDYTQNRGTIGCRSPGIPVWQMEWPKEPVEIFIPD